MNRYGDLDDWKHKALQPWVWKWTDLEVKASAAEAELDHHSARDFRRQARIVKKHIERLQSL